MTRDTQLVIVGHVESLATSIIVVAHATHHVTDIAKRPHLKPRWVEQRKKLYGTKNQRRRRTNEWLGVTNTIIMIVTSTSLTMYLIM
jgi:hypothetical protein